MNTHAMLSPRPKKWLKGFMRQNNITLNIKALEGILYLLRSGCHWRLIPQTLVKYPSIKVLKTDIGYRGKIIELLHSTLAVDMQCIKSNFGTAQFIPIEGRWVVERTIAWLGNFRRLTRNYE